MSCRFKESCIGHDGEGGAYTEKNHKMNRQVKERTSTSHIVVEAVAAVMYLDIELIEGSR